MYSFLRGVEDAFGGVFGAGGVGHRILRVLVCAEGFVGGRGGGVFFNLPQCTNAMHKCLAYLDVRDWGLGGRVAASVTTSGAAMVLPVSLTGSTALLQSGSGRVGLVSKARVEKFRRTIQYQGQCRLPYST